MKNNYNKIELPKMLTKNGFINSQKLKDRIDKDELEHIICFINQRFSKTNPINKTISSYGLKHLIETEINTYISNGELIASMIICGYEYKKDGINCCFNVKTDFF